MQRLRPLTVALSLAALSVLLAAPPRSGAAVTWTSIVAPARGALDRAIYPVDGATFVTVRFATDRVAFHLHVGSLDPPGVSTVPADAQPQISGWELHLGVVAAFNSGFQVFSHSGGVWVDGRTLVPLRPGLATIGIDRFGHLVIGVWGQNLPRPGFSAIAWRQNLTPLVLGGRITADARGPWYFWGGVVNKQPPEPRSALGVTANGDVLYTASMSGVDAAQLAQALVDAGAITGLELDINPGWPSLGLAPTPLTQRSQHFVGGLPGEQRSPNLYLTGSTRDFFVAVLRPPSPCTLATPGVPRPGAFPQPLRVSGCHFTAP